MESKKKADTKKPKGKNPRFLDDDPKMFKIRKKTPNKEVQKSSSRAT